jgi:hypothetical protein
VNQTILSKKSNSDKNTSCQKHFNKGIFMKKLLLVSIVALSKLTIASASIVEVYQGEYGSGRSCTLKVSSASASDGSNIVLHATTHAIMMGSNYGFRNLKGDPKNFVFYMMKDSAEQNLVSVESDGQPKLEIILSDTLNIKGYVLTKYGYTNSFYEQIICKNLKRIQ